MNEMQDAARALHAAGFATLPIKPGSKVPASAHGVKDATRDDAATDAYYATRKGHGIGVSGEGFVIFDFDVHGDANGMDALHDWEREHGELPETLAQTTPSGGYHMVYRSAREVRPSVNQELAVDVRAWGSYIVCDPTPGYCWESDLDAIADADERVMAFLEHVRPKKRAPSTSGCGKVGEGGRNHHLFREGCSAHARGVSGAELLSYLLTKNKVECSPPLPESEVEKTADSINKLPAGLSDEVLERQEKRGRPRKFEHNKVAAELIALGGACLIDGETPAIRLADGRYRIGWDAFDTAIIDMHDDCTTANRKEAKAYVKAKAPHARQSAPELIAFANGVLDVRTMELRDFREDDLIPNIIPHRWNLEARSEAVDTVLEKIACGDIGMQLNLIEVIGLCMFRSSRYGYCPVLLGTGSNGKSTYIDMIWNVLGDENVSALQPREIGTRFQAGQLAGKLANLGDDISSDYIDADSCAIVKKIATGSQLYTDVKGSAGFKFKPYATMVFSANEFPRLGDTTYGMYRRLFPMSFNAVFRREDADFDPNIGEKLADEQALEYLCVLGVEGLRSVMAQNALTPNETSRRILKDIEVDNSTVMQWIIANGITADDVKGRPAQEAYSDYKGWCQDNGVQFVGSRKFNGTLAAHWHIRPTKIAHSTQAGMRKTIRVFE